MNRYAESLAVSDGWKENGGALLSFIVFLAFVLILLFGATGCAQIGSAPMPGKPGVTVEQFTRADVTAALAIANENADKQGQACYGALLAVLPMDQSSPTAPTGLVSIFEAGRVARMQLQAGLPDSVTSACAPMMLNSQAALLNSIMFVKIAP